MKLWHYTLIFFFCAISSTTLAQPPVLSDQVNTRFLGDVSLQQLSRGENGNGILLYYLSQNGPERPNLVVHLSKQLGTDIAVAEVYDTPAGNDFIPLTIQGDHVALTPTLTPTITIKALGGWWVRDGLVNYNLDIQVNGPVYAMWGGGFDPKFGPAAWAELIKPREPAANITVRDPDQEGLPKWDLRLLLPSFGGQGYYRANYAERKCKTPLKVDFGVSPLWPFVAEAGGYEQPNSMLRPPIVVDWERGKITHFSEIVTVRNQNCSYSLYSISSLEPGQVNKANFETPFAFYDLSGQGKGFPNLILRTERFPAGDPWSVGLDPRVQRGRPAPRDLETVRYSWRNAVGDGLWDYKVEVLGFHPYTFETPIAGGFTSIDAPPYELFPRWVIERSWPVVTFIDTEGNSYRASEGIYDWSPREVGIGYVFGWKEVSDPSAFSEISAGFRGEYRFLKNLPPRLYLSPIDNRLHLWGAEGGLWNLRAGLVLREHNLDGGSYVNGWTRERILVAATKRSEESQPAVPGEVEEALYALKGYLIYSGPEGVELRQAAYQPSSFEILPPTAKAGWQFFQEQLAPYTAQKRNPKDLKSWLGHFPGETLTIAGGQISEIRAIGGGFRFVLNLQPGFRTHGSNLFDVRRLKPGDYAVTYNGHFTVEPLTPPTLSVSLTKVTLTQLEPGPLQVALRNDGLQDIPQATLELWAAPPQGQATLVTSQTVALLAQAPITPTLQWAPPSAGQWTLTPQIRRPDGQPIIFKPAQIAVLPVKAADPEALISASTSPETLSFIMLGLVALAVIMALVYWHQWRTSLQEQGDGEA